MDFNKFTIKSQEAVQNAQTIAMENGHQIIETSHLLKGILRADENVVPHLFKKLNINQDVVNRALDKMIDSHPKVSGADIQWSRNAGTVLTKVLTYLREFGDEYVSIEHLLLSLTEASDNTGQLLRDSGMNKKELIAAIKDLRKGEKVTSASQEESYNALNKYAKNLNQMARDGKLDPVIGRAEEIRRVLQILTRRTKNNPMLVGEPGVGKTAIAEGLAHRIIQEIGRASCRERVERAGGSSTMV